MKEMQRHYFSVSALKLRRFFPFAVCLILLQTVFFDTYAQSEWQWANFWTGNDDPLSSTNAYNYVVKTAFDDEGNIYAFGSCGGTAQVVDQQTAVHLSNNPIVLTARTRGSVLVKFDRNGNLLWSRLIKNSGLGADTDPYDMFFDGDKIVIAGNYQFQAMEQLWFFDTLIYNQQVAGIPWEEQHPPYAVGNFTYFVTFDLDGNRLATSIVHTLSREFYESIGMRGNSFLGNKGSICIDSRGSTYIAVDVTYTGPDTMPYTIVVDKDTNRMSFDVYFPENCCYMNGVWSPINNTLLYKFSSDWELEWVRRIVDHAEGLSPYLPRDTINPCYVAVSGGLSIDDNDKLYLSGYLTDMMMMDEHNQYPMHIYWDSVHYATVLNYGMAYYTPYIVKYDSDGNVLWSNQAYVRNESNSVSLSTNWFDNCINDDGVYLIGRKTNIPGYQTMYYFDGEENQLPNFDGQQVYFVKFDKQTGQFVNYGIMPGQTSVSNRIRPTVINNHLLFQVVGLGVQQTSTLLCYFNTNGQFMGADTISYTIDDWHKSGGVVVSDEGYILCDMMNSQDLTFGHDMTLDLYNDNRSCAIIALKYDPSILEPYPEEPVEVKKYDERLDRIRLYPNPATDRITIESPEDLPIDGVAITNLAGQFLGVRIVDATHADISVRDLPAGTYIAHINTRTGNTERKFVVKR
ncbi:MAG: T9SS type A sorting domain-containing protein [Bacteroidales bacterium]|nr:T9SS type A sorting domain-containing protein [Bacteroidales bacterium]